MKRVFMISVCLLIGYIVAIAYTTTITTPIYGTASGPPAINPPCCPLPTGTRRVHFINHTNNNIPELETALDVANCIFTDAMAQENIDMVPLEVEVLLEDLGIDSSIICKVEIIYSDTIDENSSYHNIEEYANAGTLPVLVPMAMSNQSRRGNYGTAMRIKLRPNVSYHCDTTQAPVGKLIPTRDKIHNMANMMRLLYY